MRLRGLRGGWWYFQVPWDYRPYQPETRRYTASPQSTESFPNNERTDAKRAWNESVCTTRIVRRGRGCCRSESRNACTIYVIVSLDWQGRESNKIKEGWYGRISFSRDGYTCTSALLCVSCVIITAIGSCERVTWEDRPFLQRGRSGSSSTLTLTWLSFYRLITRFHRDYKF